MHRSYGTEIGIARKTVKYFTDALEWKIKYDEPVIIKNDESDRAKKALLDDKKQNDRALTQASSQHGTSSIVQTPLPQTSTKVNDSSKIVPLPNITSNNNLTSDSGKKDVSISNNKIAGQPIRQDSLAYNSSANIKSNNSPFSNQINNNPYNSPNNISQTYTSDNKKNHYKYKKANNKPIIFILISVILFLSGAIGAFVYLDKNRYLNNSHESISADNTISENSNIIPENKTEVFTTVYNLQKDDIAASYNISSKTESKQAKTSQTTVSIKETTAITSPTNISVNKDEVYKEYLDIINNMDFSPPHRGFFTDLNGDNINELIIPDASDMTYAIYYYENEYIKLYKFGGFMALDNFVMYKVDGDNGKKYIYFRDNYSYKSAQGYFSLDTLSEIDILVRYPDSGNGIADWSIFYNDTEVYAEGNENVNKLYGETKQCYAKLLESFKNYGFAISDKSKYNSIDGLYYNDLIKQLENNIQKSDKQSSITSCKKYGTIYSPNGNKIDGLTRSYLIDGGSATYERHDLTHGWHVTAVSEYYDGSSYWYELYDSDDGDYYGWVAAKNINFY